MLVDTGVDASACATEFPTFDGKNHVDGKKLHRPLWAKRADPVVQAFTQRRFVDRCIFRYVTTLRDASIMLPQKVIPCDGVMMGESLNM